MIGIRRLATASLLLVVLAAGAAGAQAEEEASSERAQDTAEGQETRDDGEPARASEDASDLVVYVPPGRGATSARSGAGTRGPEVLPAIAVLAPDHVGVTLRAQPTLAWFVSRTTGGRVDFTLIAETAEEPLLETSLEGPFEAGVHLVRLADYGVTLEAGVPYTWSIALVPDPDRRDRDVVAAGMIRRDPDPAAGAATTGSGPAPYRALARRGIWYDALAELSDAIAARPADDALRRQRASLLEQVGVGAAAVFERERASHAEAPERGAEAE